MRSKQILLPVLAVAALIAIPIGLLSTPAGYDSTRETMERIAKMKVRPTDWPMWGGSPLRNNTPEAKGIAADWNLDTGRNIKWAANLGSQTYGNPVIANGKVYVGSNNGSGYLKRFPGAVDLGVLLCFDEATGKFLWQHSSEKLPTGRVHDWPLQGICSAPCAEGDRLWYVTSRGEVVCLDSEGFLDGENDGPFNKEQNENKDEADVVWKVDMMSQLGVSQHNMCSCSVTFAGNTLFVITSNGVDEGHLNLPAPHAPSFIALDRNTGKVLWTDNSPGINVLHGQWSSPAYGVLAGVPQVLFGGGDGWLYSFHGESSKDGKPELLWKFDANPKESIYVLGAKSSRNHIIGTPVIYDGLVYVAVGEDPEHGEGTGHLWCIDPTKRGDVSPQLVVNKKDPKTPIPHKRLKACEPEMGDMAIDNPSSAVVWHYSQNDSNGDGKVEFEEEMHRTCGTVTIKDNLLFLADFSGVLHCIDAKTGKQHWAHDMLAACWSSALIADGRVYIGDEDGDLAIFAFSPKKELIREINMKNSVYTTPVVANGTLFIANRTQLFAIVEGAQSGKK